jgi:hypothetical protein
VERLSKKTKRELIEEAAAKAGREAYDKEHEWVFIERYYMLS